MYHQIRHRNFFESAQKFFEPCLSNRLILWKGIFVAFIWGINGIAHVIFLERLTYYLLNQPGNFATVLELYIAYLLIYEVVNFSVRKWGWVELLGTSWKYISDVYLTRFVRLDNNAVEAMGTGKLISIMGSGVEKWGLLIWDVIEHAVALILALVFTLYMVGKIHPLYPFLFIGLFLGFFYISRFFNTKMVPYRFERNENAINISKHVVKVIMSKNEVLQSDKIQIENEKIDRLYDRDISINQHMGTHRAFLTRNSGFSIAILLILSYYFLGYGYLEGRVELSTLVGLSGTLIVIQKVIYENLSFYIDFTKEFVKVTKLWDFFDATPEILGYDDGELFQYKNGTIELKDISFGYGENKNIFDHFDLLVAGGKITAFVGNSGGGKSTLVKIISQYIKQDSGSLCIDGQDISTVSLKSYYQNIGYLTQEPSIFDGTIFENLTYSLHEDMESPELLNRMHQIIELAKCEFIYDLQSGLDTQIGERGVRLSGGQKQRLAIAKIMLKDPHIIILDEPTSALDSFSEDLITKAMNNLFSGRTVLIIAHRLQTVRHADDIIVIEGGELVERGNHGALVSSGGVYARMLELQSGF